MQLKTVFFGSGPVAAKSLALLAPEFDIEAVVTKPKPPHHHGAFPVLDTAAQLKLPVHTVSNKQELSHLIATKPFTSTVAVLIDFGIIVAQDTIDYFPKGIVNSHFSLLPQWRGADPITFAILSGQKQTGVSLMLLVEKMDEGPLLAQTPYDIEPDETTPSLTENLIEISAASLTQILPLWAADHIHAAPQEQITMAAPEPTYSRKLTKQDGELDWTKPAVQLEREIRAYLDWPKSHAKLGDIDVIITQAHSTTSAAGQPGAIHILESTLAVSCGDGSLLIDKLKPAGKPEMTIQAFLAGYGQKLRAALE